MSLKNLAPKTKGILALSATGAIAIIAIIIYTIYVNKYLAITMRLQRLVGDVVLYDDGGSEQALKEKMRLQSGQSITTAGESLIMVSLDDTKLLTMEESSLAEIRTKRKHLEFHLLEGNLFFNVTKKLADNESFDIETATMVCGIRGTSAYVGRDSSRHEILMVTDGVVHVVATNPRTLEVTETDVYAGEMITVYLDEEAEGNATISLYKRKFREEDLPALALDTIAKNDELKRRIVDACGFDEEKLDALAEVSTVRGVSMYGDAARELYDMGKEDSIPLMGYRATEMITAANSACDIAVDDLPLEIAIIRGLRDVLDVGIDANYDEVPLNTLMTSAEDSYSEIYSTLESAGVSGDDAINVVNVVSETLRESAIQMTSSGLTVEEVKEVFDATSYLFNEAITGAVAEPGESFSSVSEAISAAVSETKEYVTGTVTSEMIKDSNGEETVIALLRRPAAQQTPDDTEVENPDVTDPDVTDSDADDEDNANGAGQGNAGGDNAGKGDNAGNGNKGNDSAGNAGAGNDDAGNNSIGDAGATGANGGTGDNSSSNTSGSSSSSSSSGNASGNSSGNTTPQVTHSVSLVTASDETIVSGNITSYVEGQAYTLPTNVTKTPTAYIQYVFEGWYTSQTGGNPITGIDSSATNDIVLYARFTEAARVYNVTLVTDGGTIAGGPITSYPYDAAKYVSLPSANEMSKDPDANYTYTFEGWYTAQTGGVEVTRIAEGETGDKTYYAHWIQSPRTYAISRSSTVHGTMLVSDGNTSPTQATVGQTITVTLNPDNNYVVDALTVTKSSGGTVSTSLTGQSSDSKTYSFTMPADGVALSATFIGKEFDITTWHTAADTTMGTVQVLVGGTAVTKARYGETVTVNMTPETGYALDTTNAEYNRIQYYNGGWQGISTTNLLQSGTNTFTMPAGQVRLNAIFKLDNYVHFPRPNYGNTYATHSTTTVNTVSAEPNLNVAPGGTITLDLRPNNGYTLTQLRVYTGTIGTPNNNYLESSLTFTENTANRNYSATLTMPDHKVTIIPTYTQVTANIAVSDTHLSTDVQTAKKDDTVTITATPETGYELDTLTVTRADNQTVTVSGTGNTRTFTMPGQAVTVTATYKLTDYSVSVATGITNGTVATDVTTANYGDTVTVTVTPSSGYNIDTLTYTPAGGSATAITQTNGVYSFTMPAANVTINGTFAQPTTNTDYLYCTYDSSDNTVHVYATNAAGRTEVLRPADMLWDDNGDPQTVEYVSFEEVVSPDTTYQWFEGMEDLIAVDNISRLHTGSVTDMSNMFYECHALQTLDLSGFDTTSVTDMSEMFDECFNLSTPDFSSFDTSSVTDMDYMFHYCYGFTSLDLGSFDTSGVISMRGMFDQCSSLQEIKVNPATFDVSSVTDFTYMFDDCDNLVGGAGTAFISSSYNGDGAAFARIDGGTAHPGFFTYSGSNAYLISVDSSVTNGTINVNYFAAVDDVVTFTVTPDSNYTIGTVSGTYGGNSTVNVTPTSTPGEYQFTMPGSNVTLTATFVSSGSSSGVTIGSMTNGSVAASSTTPSAGDTVTLTVTPTAGYKLDTLTVTGSSGAVTTTTVTTGVVYRFTMPSTGVTVNATFVADNTNRTVSVLAASNDKGDVSASTSSCTSGTVVTLTVTNLVNGYHPEITVSDMSNSNVTVPVTEIDSTHFTFVMPAFNVRVRTKYIGPYAVNIGTLTNGSVTSNYTSTVENEEVILTAHPATGYEVDTVTVTQSDGTTVSVGPYSGDSNAANGYFKYSFYMPATDVSVDVTFKVATTQYSITVHQPSGATLTADHTSATPGTLITVTTDPSITVNYVYYMVDSSDHYIYNAPYTFRMPYGDVDIYCDY